MLCDNITMKRFLPIVLLTVAVALLGVMLPAWAMQPGLQPKRFSDARSYGIGVYFAPSVMPLYAHPDPASEPMDVWTWKPDSRGMYVKSEAKRLSEPAGRRFLAFYPTLKMAVLPVVGDNGEGWVEVLIEPRRGANDPKATAWVPLREKFNPDDTTEWPRHWARFQPWLDFMRANARATGIVWLSGVPEYQRSLRQQPKDDAELLDLTLIRQLKVHHARGNWLLVEAWDFNRESPIGWVRWRDKEGKLLVFPNFAQKRDAMIPGLF